MGSLREMGLIKALQDAVLRKKTFFLGVCVGMQILFEHSEEEGTECLGWLKGKVVRFQSDSDGNAAGTKMRVPQMGWNRVCFKQNRPVKTQDDFFYFVNSFYAMPEKADDLWGSAFYGGTFAAAVCKDNILATQFHVEKSGEAGLALLQGFLSLRKGV